MILKKLVRCFRGWTVVDELVAAVEQVLPPERPIQLHAHYLNGAELTNAQTCLNGHLTSHDWIEKFEADLAAYCGVEQAVCVSSGTAALHLILLAAGVKPDEEVLVPSLSFIASANVIKYCGAIPNFVDSGITGINVYKLRRYLERTTSSTPDRKGRLNSKTGRVISALIAVDLLGVPADFDKLESLAREFGLILIEDAAQALGASGGARKCGSFGRAAALSFNNNKIITTNGGGAILTDDAWIAAKVASLATQHKVRHLYKMDHDGIGFNYRMGNINAAIGVAQLGQIEYFMEQKKKLNAAYKLAFDGRAAVFSAKETWHGQPNYWLNAVALKDRSERDSFLQELAERGIFARAMFPLINSFPMYEDCPSDDMSYSNIVSDRVVCLPSGVGLVK